MDENQELIQPEQLQLEPFTLEDAVEDDKACLLCTHRVRCPIIIYVNKLSIKRDGKVADDEFSCYFFKEENEETENITE